MSASPQLWRAGLFAAFGLALAVAGVGGTLAGRLFDPLLGTAGEGGAGAFRDLATGLLIAGALWANWEAIRRLPFRAQVGIFWAELLILFVAFFLSFDRDFGILFKTTRDGETNLAFLITTGAVTTLYVSAFAIVFASALALAVALGRLSSSGPLYAIATFYISFFRGTPLLLQVYVIYLGLPQFGPQFAMDAVPSGVLALSLCYGAYMAEIFRAGIQGVPEGQSEAARALGIRSGVIFRRIVFPQAMRLIVPPTGNQFIAMLKDSSLVSVMGVWELTKTAQLLGKRDFRVFEMLIAAAVIYWAMSIVFELVQSRVEKHYGKGDRR